MDDFDQVQPRPDEINALPENMRRYVMELETRCDPAGDVAALALTRDQCRQLEASNATLREKLEASEASAEAAEAEVERFRECYRDDDSTMMFCGLHPTHSTPQDDRHRCDCTAETGCRLALSAEG